MKFYINGEQIDVTLENEKTVGDILKSFQQTCEDNKMATIAIKYNDTVVNAESFDEIAKKELNDETKLDMTIISENDVIQALSSLKTPFIDIQKDIKEIPVLLQSGKDSEVNKTITALADLIDQLCHSATFTALFPDRFGILKFGDQTLAEFFAEFSKILGDFKDALENKDTVTIGDLAEYEICPHIDQIAQSLEALNG